jgi:hypothetical protein
MVILIGIKCHFNNEKPMDSTNYSISETLGYSSGSDENVERFTVDFVGVARGFSIMQSYNSKVVDACIEDLSAPLWWNPDL